jgi:hypothetical protein
MRRVPKPKEEKLRGWESNPKQAEERCKHGGLFRCDKCGTGSERDAGHRTRGGKGSVGRL